MRPFVRHRRGITLIELLVAMIITGLVIGFALSIFKSERENYTTNRAKIKAQANAREAMRIIEQELRNTGLRVATSVDSRGFLTTADLTNALISGSLDSASLQAGSTGSSVSGDSITFVQNGVDPAAGRVTSLSEDFWVRYKLSADTLYRIDASSEGELPTAAANRVPFLKDVVAFQIQYGLGASDTAMWTSAALNDVSFNPIDLTDGFDGASKTHTFTGWSSAAERRAVSASSSSRALVPGMTYLIQFQMYPDGLFVDTLEGISYLRVGFSDAAGSVAYSQDSVTVPIGKLSTSRNIWLYLAPKSAGQKRFFVSGRLMTTATTGHSVQVSNLSITEAFPTQYRWVNDPAPADKRLIRAVRVWLLARTQQEAKSSGTRVYAMGDYSVTIPTTDKRAYVLYQRIIPVVNNGL